MSLDAAKTRILANTPLESLIGEDTKVSHKAGRATALCPFHSEKSPSFIIYEDHYHCFGCQAHGDAITYAREKKGLGFMDALRFLAEKYHISAPELDQSHRDQEETHKMARLFRALTAAQSLFQENLLRNGQGNPALQYLTNRGFTTEAIGELGFGYSPDDGRHMIGKLQAQGFGQQELDACSLVFQSSRTQKYYDFLRHRITIPIHDSHGRIIGFGGRSLGDEKPKYKNSRDTLLFDKSRVIFGLHKARPHMRSKNRALLVEGYMDTLSLWQYGFGEAVACMGTATTLTHLKTLSHATSTLYLLFDADQGGRNANLRTVSLAIQTPHLAIKVAKLPAGHDPDSFVRAHGADALEQVLAESQDLLTYAIKERLANAHQMEVPHLITNEFSTWIRSISEPVYRSYVIGQLADISGVPRQTIEAQCRTGQQPQAPSTRESSQEPTKPPLPKQTPIEALSRQEYELLGHLFFAEPESLPVDEYRQWLQGTLTWHPLWQELAEGFLAALGSGAPPSQADISLWPAIVNPKVLATLERLKEDAALFVIPAGGTRDTSLAKIKREYETQKLYQTRQQLKEKLSASAAAPQSTDEIRQILEAVKAVNLKLKQLQSLTGATVSSN